MKKASFAILVLLTAVFIISAGCTVKSDMSAAQPPTSETVQKITTAAATPVQSPIPTTLAGAVLFDESFSMKSGYQNVYKKYPLEDYGYLYLYPGDTFRVSVTASRPVNVLLIGKTDEIKFDSVEPAWDTTLKPDQWDYSPLVPEFAQSNVEKKDMTFTIKDKSTYFLIIDPRFSSDLEGWKVSKHDEVKGTVRLVKS